MASETAPEQQSLASSFMRATPPDLRNACEQIGDLSSRHDVVRRVSELSKQVKQRMKQLEPHLEKLRPLLKHLDALYKKALEAHKRYARDYHSDEVFKLGFAIALLFAGGRFSMTIACVQSFHMAGWQATVTAWKQLQLSYRTCLENLQQSEEGWQILGVDRNHELTVSDFLIRFKKAFFAESQVDRDAAMKQCLLIAKCVDPNELLDAGKNVWTGVIAVISTLRSRFAYAVGLGANISSVMYNSIQTYMHDRLDQLSLEHRRWTDVGLRNACGLVGIALSFYLARVMNALNSAFQGSTALTKVMFDHINQQKDLPPGSRSAIGKYVLSLPEQMHTKLSKEQEIVKWVIAMVGFTYQVRNRFDFPLLIKVPLAPFYLTEYYLSLLASSRSF